MTDLVKEGEAVEGDVVEGRSRNPIQDLGLFRHGEVRCNRYKASFDVRAHVVEGGPPNIFFANASNSPAEEIVAEQALVLSLDRKPAADVVKGSASHRTNAWRFTKRTGVQVLRTHQQIRNAIEARQRIAREPEAKQLPPSDTAGRSRDK